MNSEDILRTIRLHAETGITVCISGAPGIGKTEVTEQYAARERAARPYFYQQFNAALANLADTQGFMVPEKRRYTVSEGQQQDILAGTFTYPYYFMDLYTGQPAFMYEQGMIVIEEYGQAQPDVKRGLATLIKERRVGDHKLPPGFQIVMTTNRPEDRSGVGKDFDFVINRRCDIPFTAELDPWLSWCAANNVEPLTMAFGARNQEIVFAGKVPEKQGPFCTPRSLVNAGKFLAACAKAGIAIDDPLAIRNLAGMISNGTAMQLITFAKLKDSLPKLSAIQNDPEGTPIPKELDALAVVAFELAHRANITNIDALYRYMRRAPKAFAVNFVKTAIKRDDSLISTSALGSWIRENANLLKAVSDK
jgi:hypothetical protein